MNNSTKDADVVPREAIFANGLEKLGCKQGQNLILDVRWSAGDRTLMGRYGSHPEGERRQAIFRFNWRQSSVLLLIRRPPARLTWICRWD
jgi:hypothetical protein